MSTRPAPSGRVRSLDFRVLVPGATSRPDIQELGAQPRRRGGPPPSAPQAKTPEGDRQSDERSEGGVSGLGADNVTPLILTVRPADERTVYGELGMTPAPSPVFSPIPAPPLPPGLRPSRMGPEGGRGGEDDGVMMASFSDLGHRHAQLSSGASLQTGGEEDEYYELPRAPLGPHGSGEQGHCFMCPV